MKNINLSMKYIKAYKLRSLAIIISIVFSIALIVGVGSLNATNNNLELQKMKYQTGIYHAEFKGIDKKQLKIIEENENIQQIGLLSLYNSTSKKEKQSIDIMSANNDYILSNSKLVEGKLPKEKNEMIAEAWVLRSLGIEPKVNSEITLNVKNEKNEFKDETFKLVGIVSDKIPDKSKGLKYLYVPFNTYRGNPIFANIVFKENIDIPSEVNKISKKINIPNKNVYCMSDMISVEKLNNEIGFQWIQITIGISLICGIVIYGIFNISVYKRIKEYGMLRSIGYNNIQIFKLVLQELFYLFIISLPLGLIIGAFGATVFNYLSEKNNISIILNGKPVYLGIIFPIKMILVSIIFIGIMMILISFLVYRIIKRISIIDAIKENIDSNNKKRSFNTPKFMKKYMKIYKIISCKSIFKSKRNFVMIVASMSICGILFITLDYKLSLSDYRDMELIRINHMNSDFSVDRYNGVSDKTIKNINNINGVKNIETCMLTPSKLILNERNILNQKYFDKLNSQVDKDKFDYYLGKDKHTNELILRNNFRGYDNAALEKLKNYKLKGDININEMKNKDIAIVYIPQVNKKNNYIPLTKGEGIVDIKPGDKITLKFRKDKVHYYDDEYDKSKDETTDYIYKEFTVGATVSYDYMFEGFSSGFYNVEVIVNQDRFKEITGINTYLSTNVNLDEDANYKEVEKEILNKISGVKGVQFRNLVQEKEDMKSIHNKGKMYNLGINIIIFIIIIVNIINSINHIMMSRNNEFATLRAMGLNDVSFKKMIKFEGLLYGTIASIIVVLVSLIIQKFIYIKSNIIMVGVEFNIDYTNYIIVVIMNLLLSVMIAYLQYKKLKNKSLIECINKVQ